ncbi:hypothetical protein BU16DRAFT_566866 [Lophium mytilinum]|uniref:RING-type domain-containing protein n=1 Tax=Lophium mytilinum TaxID=390894 RepID=A0A6A6QBI8_9PEZI|nr:hypothetical protein BU16DRAFT_566866 [Lophium mytilinum]
MAVGSEIANGELSSSGRANATPDITATGTPISGGRGSYLNHDGSTAMLEEDSEESEGTVAMADGDIDIVESIFLEFEQIVHAFIIRGSNFHREVDRILDTPSLEWSREDKALARTNRDIQRILAAQLLDIEAIGNEDDPIRYVSLYIRHLYAGLRYLCITESHEDQAGIWKAIRENGANQHFSTVIRFLKREIRSCWNVLENPHTVPGVLQDVEMENLGPDPRIEDISTPMNCDSTNADRSDSQICVICYERYSDVHPAVRLVCGHGIGLECGRAWILGDQKQSHSCPLCRFQLLQPRERRLKPDQVDRRLRRLLASTSAHLQLCEEYLFQVADLLQPVQPFGIDVRQVLLDLVETEGDELNL